MNRYRAQLSFSQVMDANQNLPLTHADAEILHIGETGPVNFYHTYEVLDI